MRNTRRAVDPAKRMNRLQKKHAQLKERVAELDGRNFLTNAEELEKQKLKKQKLATKDALETIRREVVGN